MTQLTPEDLIKGTPVRSKLNGQIGHITQILGSEIIVKWEHFGPSYRYSKDYVLGSLEKIVRETEKRS